jgi:hypothetical protein
MPSSPDAEHSHVSVPVSGAMIPIHTGAEKSSCPTRGPLNLYQRQPLTNPRNKNETSSSEQASGFSHWDDWPKSAQGYRFRSISAGVTMKESRTSSLCDKTDLNPCPFYGNTSILLPLEITTLFPTHNSALCMS